uniref:Peptidase C48, SUMO/sentrin/Ubl1 n=1 Tax=Tanacetum cinerariifolium TaxID=118510 RepID=A0A699H9A5_TANCI|nr:peptidase C48, SUMO/sentrin/Ubl1 [Tanacetum cinerariifolium]
MAARKRRSKVDSSSFQVADANDGGLAKHKNKSSKGNEVLQPKPSRNTKSSVRRISKKVVKPKGAPVKSNVGKMKRLVEDKEVEADVEADVEGNESEKANESKKDNESEEAEEIEEDKESEVAKEVVKDVKTKVVKGKKKVVLSKSKKRNKKVEADVKGNESEADESEEEVVKDVKTNIVNGKCTKGNNKGVDSKAKKLKYVFDFSEEQKVSKPKKVYKKKQVSESSSSYEDEKPLKIKKRSKKKSKKPLTAEQIKKIKYFDDLPGVRSRTVPSSLFTAIRDSQVDMESFMSDIGFFSLHNVYIKTLPRRFARFMVRAFSASSYEFKLEKGITCVTPEKVHEILGVPLGGTFIFDLPEKPLDDPFVKEWFKQFDRKPLKKICACDIAEKLVLTFKVNFLMLFANVMSTADTKKAIVNLTELEIQDQVISKLDLHGELTESELDQIEEFYSMIEEKISMISAEKIALEDLSKKANAEFSNDEKVIELCEKYRILFKESVFVEDFQAHIDDFDNNDNDGGGKNDVYGSDNVGKKKESVAKDVVNAKKDGVIAEKDDMNVVQEGEADVNEEPEDMLDEETFTQWIEKNIDWVGEWKVFLDEISAQFEHDVTSSSLSGVDLALFPICSSGHFYVVVFHLKSPSMMMILDNSNCGETCNSKYKAVCEPLKKFFAMHLKNYNHPKHISIAKLKHRIPKLKWSTTKNHSDCEVFTMIHLEHYFGKPVGQWDFGLCKELDEQVSMLRRMRFKIATTILLHEFNVHAEKMFDLTFKLESKNDKQTRISIIVNAIKDMDEHDPGKTNNFVENHEEDALKNK